MSSDTVFLIVEGKRIDRHFYDRVLSSDTMLKKAGYQIHLAEQVENARGISAGGKKAVLALFDNTKSASKLIQRNSAGPSVILFAVDRDHDFVTGGTRRSPHVIYTRHADVEADIFANGDDGGALAMALSLDAKSADRLAQSIGDWRKDLADTWRDWIHLCCKAGALGARCSLKISKESWINTDGYGPVDPIKRAAAEKLLDESVTYSGDISRKSILIAGKIDRLYERGQAASLVKGKLMPRYLHHRVLEALDANDADFGGFDMGVVKAYLSTVDFSASWVDDIRKHIRATVGLDQPIAGDNDHHSIG